MYGTPAPDSESETDGCYRSVMTRRKYPKRAPATNFAEFYGARSLGQPRRFLQRIYEKAGISRPRLDP